MQKMQLPQPWDLPRDYMHNKGRHAGIFVSAGLDWMEPGSRNVRCYA